MPNPGPQPGSGIWALLQVLTVDAGWQPLLPTIGKAMRHVSPSVARRKMDQVERAAMLQGTVPKERTLEDRIAAGQVFTARSACQNKTWFELDNSKQPTKIRRIK